MKKMILALLLGLSVSHVASVVAEGEVAKDTVKKESRIKSFIKNNKVALTVATAAIVAAYGIESFRAGAGTGDHVQTPAHGIIPPTYKATRKIEAAKFGKAKPMDMEKDQVINKVLFEAYKGNKADFVVAEAEQAAADAVMAPNEGFAKYKHKLGIGAGEVFLNDVTYIFNTFVNPFKPWTIELKDNKLVSAGNVILDLALILALVDFGNTIILKRPELAKSLVNKLFAKQAKTEEVK